MDGVDAVMKKTGGVECDPALDRYANVIGTIANAIRSIVSDLAQDLPPTERAFLLRSVWLSLFVQALARDDEQTRAHMIAELPRLVEFELAHGERSECHGNAD